MLEYVLQPELPFAYVSPFEQPAWQDALRATLDPAQLAVWQAKDAERTQAVELRAREVLAVIEADTRKAIIAPLLAEAGEIRRTVLLDAERGTKLEAAARSEAETCVAERRRTVFRQYLEMSEAKLGEWLAQRDGTGTYCPTQLTRENARWNAAIAGLLTPEEFRRVAAAWAERSARQRQAIAREMVLILDDRLGFTRRQREQLLPLAERLTRDDPAFLQPGPDGAEHEIAPAAFRAVTTRALKEELTPILDPAQLRRWKLLSTLDSPPPDGEPAVGAAAGAVPVSLPSEPEQLEAVLSDLFARQEPSARKRLLEDATVEVESVARVCGVTGGPLHRLETAARGAMEIELRGWRRSAENSARARLHGAGQQSVPELVAAVQSGQAVSEERTKIDDQPVWKETLQEVRAGFTPAQREAWETEQKARADFRQSTIVRSVAADFDRRYLLTGDQPARIEEQLAELVKQYEPELSEKDGDSSWYLQLPGKLVVVAGIPPETLQRILSPDQWTAWSAVENSDLANTWKTVVESHLHK